jgi:hypothetical protein
MERGESAGQSYFGGNWVALPDERAHDNALRLARMHPVIAFEGVAEGQIAEMCLFRLGGTLVPITGSLNSIC